MVTSDTLDFDDIQPNDLNLLLKNLASVVSEPRHLDVYRLGYRFFSIVQNYSFTESNLLQYKGVKGYVFQNQVL